MASESTLRNNVVSWCEKYLGIKEGSSQHKEIINIFNNSGLCTRYKMTTSDAWCATFVSAAFIAQGLTNKCFPCVECSCANMITLAKNAGLWVENDAYKPSKGDIILYDWQDSGSGDNTGTPDHVGIVATAVSGSTFKVIEGNKSDTVGYRSMSVNGRYIRGFITPNYAAAADSSSSGTTSGTTSGTSGTKSGSTEEFKADGEWGPITTKYVQKWLGTEQDGIISHQYSSYKSQNPGLLSTTFEWEKKPSGYSPCIKALQKKVGASEDGHIGPKTITKMQKYFGTTQDGYCSKPSDVVKAMQKKLGAK